MAGRKKRGAIHPQIKERLGYDPNLPDAEFLSDWKKRSTHVCKPCWELKYCPYGPFVEQSPLLPPLRQSSVEHHAYLKGCLESGMIGHSGPMSDLTRQALQSLVDLHAEEPSAFLKYVARNVSRNKAFEDSTAKGEDLASIVGGPLPPIQECRVPFSFEEDAVPDEEPEVPAEIQEAADLEIAKIKTALRTGVFDNRKPLDPARRKWFEKEVASFDPSAYPEQIPDVVSDMACNIFGHICPVVFVGENITETSDQRRRGRYISFAVKMRVVRRDNHTCQECGKHLRDDEVEFDHIIPVAKGGSSEEHNIRLTCFDCNRDKSDSVAL